MDQYEVEGDSDDSDFDEADSEDYPCIPCIALLSRFGKYKCEPGAGSFHSGSLEGPDHELTSSRLFMFLLQPSQGEVRFAHA